MLFDWLKDTKLTSQQTHHSYIFCFAHIQMEGAAYSTFYALGVHISSEGRCSYFPLPTFLFQSQVGHSLIRQVGSVLSPKMNCMHRDATRQCIGRGAKY